MCLVYTRFSHYGTLLYLCILLCHICAENVTITCSWSRRFPPVTTDISDLQEKNNLPLTCSNAYKATLKGKSPITLVGVKNTKVFLDWLFMTNVLDMCVSIENNESLNRLIILNDYITGKCEGPILSIVNNTNLRLISIRSDKFGQNMASVAIRVRGNRKLSVNDLRKLEKLRSNVNGSWDLQPEGECTLPKPLTSLEMLDQKCKNFYGPLVMQEGIAKFQYDLSKVHKFNLEGCIQIQKTNLRDVSFLMAFSSFRRMQFCSQFIRDNKKLCPRNLEYLNVFFKDIQIYNNTDQPCDECIGGFVSEQYLHKSVNCSTVYGDLIIANFRGLPSSFENLRGIEAIEGRLIIINNTGLQKFDYFSSLEKVGRSDDKVSIIIKNNGDLNFPEIPSVLDIHLKKEDRKVEIVNNPMLFRDLEQLVALSTATAEKSESAKKSDESSTAPENDEMTGSLNSENSSPHIKRINSKMVFGGIAAVSVILLCSTVIFLACRQKTQLLRLLQSRFRRQANAKKKMSLYATSNQRISQSSSVSLGIASSSKTTSTSSTAEQVRTPLKAPG